jgi:hypothetical protein
VIGAETMQEIVIGGEEEAEVELFWLGGGRRREIS